MSDQEEAAGETARPPNCGTWRVAVSIFRYFPYGGLQKDMLNAVLALQRRGADVTVFCMKWEAPERPEGVTVRLLAESGWSNHSRARNFDRELQKTLREAGEFDLHLAFNKVSGADWYFAGDMPFARRGNTLNFWKRLLPRFRTFAALERSVFSRASATEIFYLADAQKTEICRLYQTPEARLHAVPPGLDSKYRTAAALRAERRPVMRRELKLQPDERALMMIGSSFGTKGVDRAIAALAALPEEELARTRLLIAGRGDVARYRKIAARFHVGHRVRFLGPREDVPELLSAADLLIHPARNEAAGNVLLEALACGTPVLCSGNCGFAPLVAEAGCEVLNQPFRQTALDRTLLLILSAPGRLEELQRNAAAYGAYQDFYRRGDVIAEILERAVHDGKNRSESAF